MRKNKLVQVVVVALSLLASPAIGFSPPHHGTSHHRHRLRRRDRSCRDSRSSRPSSFALFLDGGEAPYEGAHEDTASAFGVSYIGGDPCGSKYNDDPFDASQDSFKPGLPDSMKERIAALAAQKTKEQNEIGRQQSSA